MKVLAAKVADLGDVLLTTPALSALHQAACEVDLLIAPHCVDVVAGAPFVRRVIAADRDVHLNPLAWRDPGRLARDVHALRRLRSEGYDALCLFHHLTTWRGVARWALLSALLGIPVRAGLDNGRGRFLTHRRVDEGFGAAHEADYWLRVAGAVAALGDGNTPAGPRPPLWLPAMPGDRAWAATWHAQALRERPYVVVHPGAGRYIPAKRWPAAHFAALARRIADAGYGVVAVGSGSERDLARDCCAGVEGACVELAGRTSIGQTAAVIERADGFVGNESFPMHLAAAAQRPAVGIFGPTNAAAWAPWPPDAPWLRVARHVTWCQPCIYTGHTLGRKAGCVPRPCLTMLRPDAVFLELRAAMEAWERARHAIVASP